MTIQFKNGQILFTGGQIAMSSNCCCGGSGGTPTPCSTYCTNCPDTILATVSGLTGIYTDQWNSANCTNANGTYPLMRTLPDVCDWSSQTSGPAGWVLMLYCYENQWGLSLSNYDLHLTEFFRWTQPHTSDCPPAAGWIPDYTNCYGCPCTGGIVTLA